MIGLERPDLGVVWVGAGAGVVSFGGTSESDLPVPLQRNPPRPEKDLPSRQQEDLK